MQPHFLNSDQPPRMAACSGIMIFRVCPLVIDDLNDQARLYLSGWRDEATSGLPTQLMDFALDLLDLMRQPGTPWPSHPIHLQRDVGTPLGVLSLRGVGLSSEASDLRLYLLIDRLSRVTPPAHQRDRDADQARRIV